MMQLSLAYDSVCLSNDTATTIGIFMKLSNNEYLDYIWSSVYIGQSTKQWSSHNDKDMQHVMSLAMKDGLLDKFR